MADLTITTIERPKLSRNKYGYTNNGQIIVGGSSYSGGGSGGGDSSGGGITYQDFTGATAVSNGSHGLVPAPGRGQQNYVLHGSGTWRQLFGGHLQYDSETGTMIFDTSVQGTKAVFDDVSVLNTLDSLLIKSTTGNIKYINSSIGNFTISNSSSNNSSIINASTGNIKNINSSIINTSIIKAKDGSIYDLVSENITTHNLEVTGLAHFFELIIDRIKAAGGAVLFTPADGFKVEEVEQSTNGYRLYWSATDDDRATHNMWKVNDQAICQSFNQAQVGHNYDISNKYYWCLVTDVSTDLNRDMHYIEISTSVKDGSVNPEIGDEIAMLGYRGTDDNNRQNAIYISAYSSLDITLQAPLFAQYTGINNFNLSNHKRSWFAANGNTIRGTLQVETGENVEDLLDDIADNVGRGIVSVTEYYLATSSSTGITTSTSGWTTTIQTVTSTNKYLWNYEKIQYTDNTSSNTSPAIIGVYGDKGQDGKGISSIVNYYLATSSSTGITRSSSGWTTTIQTITPTNRFLWNYEETVFTDNSHTYTDPHIIGTYGEKGEDGNNGEDGTDGEDGRGISSITEYYLATSSSTNITTQTPGWSTTIQAITPINKYLWNYEKVLYSDNTSSNTTPVIIGTYGDKGQDGTDGTDGRGIVSVTEYYLATSSSTGITRNSSGWTTTIQTITQTKKYLWNYEDVLYTDNTHSYTDPVIIGAYGEKGQDGQDGNDGQDGSQGPKGDDGEYYNLNALIEKCFVYINSENPNGTLAIQLQYNIQHIQGSTIETITTSSSGYHLRFKTNVSNTYYSLSNNTTSPSYTNATFLTNYHTASSKPEYIIVELCQGSSNTVINQKVIPVVFNTELLFDINASLNTITSTVQGHTSSIEDLLNRKVGGRNFASKTSDEWSDWITLRNQENQVVYVCASTYLPSPKNVGDYFTYQITIEWDDLVCSNNSSGRILAQTSIDGVYSIPNPGWNSSLINYRMASGHTLPGDEVIQYVNSQAIVEGNKDATLIRPAIRIDYISGKFRYKCVKIERGNTATDWSVNPDDIDSSIISVTNSMSQIQQTMDSITSTVNSHTTNINNLNSSLSSVQDNMSQISQRADSIESTVSSINSSINGINSSISQITQRADSIESTVAEHSNQIDWALGDPDNLYKQTSFDGGVLNQGDGWINKWQFISTVIYKCDNWTKYNTPFYEGQTTWKNLGSGTSYLYTPYLFLNGNRTYTLNCYFDSPDDAIMRIDLCKYDNVTSARNFAPIAATTQLHGNSWLDNDSDVVYFTPTTDGFYRIRFCNIVNDYDSSEDYSVELKYVRLYLGQKTIEQICKWNDLFARSFSKIQQTANDITLQVNNISLVLDSLSQNITLNGDTIINGYLVLNDQDTGFLLNSSNGTIQVSPENLGSYSDFTGKTENDILVFQSTTFVPQERIDGSWDLSGEFTYDLGEINSGTLIKFTNYFIDFMQNATVLNPTSVQSTYKIYEGTTLKSTINISTQSQQTISNYTTSSTSNLNIKVEVTALFAANTISVSGGSLKEQPLVRTTASYKITKPTNVFGMLSPNGLGFNFSNLNHFYAGPDGTIIKYGNYGLKIDSTGIFKMTNGSSWVSL